MPRKVISLPGWIPQACELMVKYDLSLTRSDRLRRNLDRTFQSRKLRPSRTEGYSKECLEEKRGAY
jgi:hypothetical protein